MIPCRDFYCRRRRADRLAARGRSVCRFRICALHLDAPCSNLRSRRFTSFAAVGLSRWRWLLRAGGHGRDQATSRWKTLRSRHSPSAGARRLRISRITPDRPMFRRRWRVARAVHATSVTCRSRRRRFGADVRPAGSRKARSLSPSDRDRGGRVIWVGLIRRQAVHFPAGRRAGRCWWNPDASAELSAAIRFAMRTLQGRCRPVGNLLVPRAIRYGARQDPPGRTLARAQCAGGARSTGPILAIRCRSRAMVTHVVWAVQPLGPNGAGDPISTR